METEPLPRLVRNLNGQDRPTESITLTIKEDAVQPAEWFVVPPALVQVRPSNDLRSAVVTPIADVTLGIGRQTLKVMSAARQGVEYFSLVISEAAARPKAPTPTPPQPVAAEMIAVID